MRRLLASAGIVGLLVGITATQSHAQPGTFSLPTVNVTDCSVPVVNISTTEGGGTLGFDFDITFDSAILKVEGVTLPPMSLTENCEYAFNDSTPGLLSISIACTDPNDTIGSGVVAAVSFSAAGVGSSALTFTKCSLDETACPTPTNGSVSISGCPAVNLSTGGQGSFGLSPGRGCISGFLASNGSAVASATTELTFDSSKFAISSCFINSNLTGLGKVLSRVTLGPGNERLTVSGGTSTIPTGQLYGCTLTIATGLAAGPYVIDNAPSASNAASVSFPASGVDGVLNVTNCAGDCNGDGQVRIGEVSRASGLFLGDPLCSGSDSTRSCPNADMIDNNGAVSIGEVTRSSCLFLAGTCSKTCP